VPQNLFEQYSKASNIYFLVIMCMQMVKVISISDGQPAMLPPMIFVILASMLKDGYEDYKRHRDDRAENEELTEVYNHSRGCFTFVEWQSVQVGDIVRVRRDSYFPADMLLLHSSGPSGLSYVETKNLDGESNLKIRSVCKELLSKRYENENELRNLTCIIGCEAPNNHLYKFDGTLYLPNEEMGDSARTNNQVPLYNNHIVLRGMSLRNTEEIYGWVLYTGRETKIQMNQAKHAYKTSTVMRITYRAIISIFVAQAVFGSIAAVLGATWMVKNLDVPYMNFSMEDKWNSNFWLNLLKMVGTWMLIMTNCVPISLLVSLEVIKLWQGSFMGWDVLMYDVN
jgi:phospholipid-transporting ATPase